MCTCTQLFPTDLDVTYADTYTHANTNTFVHANCILTRWYSKDILDKLSHTFWHTKNSYHAYFHFHPLTHTETYTHTYTFTTPLSMLKIGIGSYTYIIQSKLPMRLLIRWLNQRTNWQIIRYKEDHSTRKKVIKPKNELTNYFLTEALATINININDLQLSKGTPWAGLEIKYDLLKYFLYKRT